MLALSFSLSLRRLAMVTTGVLRTSSGKPSTATILTRSLNCRLGENLELVVDKKQFPVQPQRTCSTICMKLSIIVLAKFAFHFVLMMSNYPQSPSFCLFAEREQPECRKISLSLCFIFISLQNVSNLSAAKANVLGGEVALWTEQADAASMMSRC